MVDDCVVQHKFCNDLWHYTAASASHLVLAFKSFEVLEQKSGHGGANDYGKSFFNLVWLAKHASH